MATYTNYKGLEKPLSTETYDIAVANKNNDVIDSELHKLDLKNQCQDNLLDAEISRAKNKENEIAKNLDDEIARAKVAENELGTSITNEIDRATLAENNIQENLSDHIANESNPHKVTSEQINLGNVDNTSDIDKPVSTAQQNAIDLAVTNHNISTTSHTDIRDLISGLTTRLNALADSDDTTLDQVSEIVTYIKSNRSLIENVTTNKVNISDFNEHKDDITVHTNPTERANFTDAYNKRHTHSNKSIIDEITSTLVESWNAAKTHADSAHARTDATKVAKSTTNGNILINSIETNVYTHPSGTNPHGTTKSDVGLGNVENKSSATIRDELTKENITTALGYTPPTTNTTYGVVSTSANGLCPKRDGSTSKFLRGDGTWASPSGGGITYSDSQPASLTADMTWIGK